MSSLPDDLAKLDVEPTVEPLESDILDLIPEVVVPTASVVGDDMVPVSKVVRAAGSSSPTRTAEAKASLVQPDSQHSTARAADSEAIPRAKRSWFFTMPAWAVSTLLHTGILLVLGAISLEPVQDALAVLVMNGTANEEGSDMQAFDVEAGAEPMLSAGEESPDPIADSSPNLSASNALSTELEMAYTVGASATVASSSLAEQLTPSDMLVASSGSGLSKSLNSRVGTARRDLLEKYGGNKDSEKSVALALQWLAMHQLPDGGWSFDHERACGKKCDQPGIETGRNGATGLALMTFLGAGQTHLEGEYKESVFRGLSYLMKSMEVKGGEFPHGSWVGKGDEMYGHGIAAIAMCEAYAMTHDPSLVKPSQLCLNYIASAQTPSNGGWGYLPRDGKEDTSIAGWQLMALKSGAMGGLVIRTPTLKKAEQFLDSVQMNKGAFYGYRKPDANLNARAATSACGLLCRMYMGWPKSHPALSEGVQFISKRGPHPTNVYFNYYSTQVLKQYGGKAWDDWNPKMRDQLIKSQEKTGHAAGSWYYEDNSAGNPAKTGGRLYLTTMSAMILEVYYRYLPIYAEQTEEDLFKL